uniref:Ion_trans_2 domain-containing protein n=1 Tax=Panagrellus redivivus TaxID=6233 RepID=A0A7E4ZSE4_PANRE
MVQPRSELAFRRTSFYFIVVLLYLLLGAVVLRLLPKQRVTKIVSEKQERLDFERAELLNILWAESLARHESEWSLLANQKLDSYERTLANSLDSDEQPQPIKSFSDALHHSFLLITTIGGIDSDDLSFAAKVFSIVYAIFGIPLFYLCITQCAKAISSFWNGSNAFFFAAGCVFVTAVIYDIVEQSTDDTPFFDAIFSVFLAVSTVGEEDGRLPRALLYLVSVIAIAALRVTFQGMEKTIEKHLQSIELSFSYKIAQVQRHIEGDGKLDENMIVEEEEEPVDDDEEDY